MTANDKRMYGRGYLAGSKKAWPVHRPPVPPEPIMGALMQSFQDLRDEADGLIAGFEKDDPMFKSLSDCIDKANVAISNFGKWIKEPSHD